MKNIETYYDKLVNEVVLYAPKLASAVLVFFAGLWAINYSGKLISKTMQKRGLDVSLRSFISSLVNVSLNVILLVSVAGMLGIQTTSFVAVIGAAGLAVGLALQGSLQNFAGGVLTLVFKPYKVGDVIETLGQNGEVKEIQIFNTVLLTPDGKTVILPNGQVSNSTIINYSKNNAIRCDINLCVYEETDIDNIKKVLLETIAQNKWTMKSPAPTVVINKAGDGIGISVRPFVVPVTYWDALVDLTEDIQRCITANKVKGHMPEFIHYNAPKT